MNEELTKEEIEAKLNDANKYCQNIKKIILCALCDIGDDVYNDLTKNIIPLSDIIEELQ